MFKTLVDAVKASTDTSHKRIIAITATGGLMAILIMNCFGVHAQSEIIYSLTALSGGNSLLSVIEKR